MRDILFRGQRVDNGEWIFGGFYQQKENAIKDECEFIIGGSLNDVACAYPVIMQTVGQYTGLTDKSGNKIFEGDIVQCYGGEWCQGYWEYNDKLTIDMSNPQTMMMLYESENKDIIGNIHDNSEHLEDNP